MWFSEKDVFHCLLQAPTIRIISATIRYYLVWRLFVLILLTWTLKLVSWCLCCIFTFSSTCSRPLKSCSARMKTAREKNLGAYIGISCRRMKSEGRWRLARIWGKTNELWTLLKFHFVAKLCNNVQERTNEWSVLYNRNRGCGAGDNVKNSGFDF